MAKVERRLDTLQTVELAEGMEVHLRVAGPFLRFYAKVTPDEATMDQLCAEWPFKGRRKL
ncbi:hypothetical protein N9859_01235 [bacterium]|nr:hypothetical protein [bacterium]